MGRNDRLQNFRTIFVLFLLMNPLVVCYADLRWAAWKELIDCGALLLTVGEATSLEFLLLSRYGDHFKNEAAAFLIGPVGPAWIASLLLPCAANGPWPA